MPDIQLERTVRVWGKSHKISIYQKSETVWVAVGDYKGERIEARGSGAASAQKRWVEVARYRGK